MKTHRDGLPRLSAQGLRRRERTPWRCGASRAVRDDVRQGLLEAESLGKPPIWSQMRPVGGRRKVLTMHRIAGNFPPARRAASAISMGLHQRSLVLIQVMRPSLNGGTNFPAANAGLAIADE